MNPCKGPAAGRSRPTAERHRRTYEPPCCRRHALLYAQPLTRVVQLRVDDVLHDGETTLLRLGEPTPRPRTSRSSAAGIHRGPRQHEHRHQPRILLALPRPPGRTAGPPRPPVRTPGRDRCPGRRRHPATTPRTARPRRRGRPRLPPQDQQPSPRRERWDMESVRRRRPRKVTSRLGSPGNGCGLPGVISYVKQRVGSGPAGCAGALAQMVGQGSGRSRRGRAVRGVSGRLRRRRSARPSTRSSDKFATRRPERRDTQPTCTTSWSSPRFCG